MKTQRTLAALLAAALPAAAAAAEPERPPPTRLAELVDLELEQLTRISVTSASRREERLVETAASIFVITAEDIRRSGATTIPEALRLAPNLQVMRADANQYVISARGGLTNTANKMLVLVDGRTIYTPLFSGVFWEAQDVMLEDVDRIEVISGPGSTLWGTNAVNGLVSITTKPASRTRGALATGYGGSEQRGAAARAGAALGGADYRLYARYQDRDALQRANGLEANDASRRWQAGFRGDWSSAGRAGTLQGDYYDAAVDTPGGRRNLSGGNLQGRWTSALAGSDLGLHAYVDHSSRDHVGSFKESRDTVEAEAQLDMRRRGDHWLVWGASYRASRDKTETRPTIGFVPTSETLTTAALFGQDEWTLSPSLRAVLGLRIEHNNYTGVEWLPTARLAWRLAPEQMAWSSITRTVRSPSRIDRDAVVPGFPPYLLAPNTAFEGETATVAELGYRASLGRKTSLSLTAFNHRFEGLRIAQPIPGGQVVYANGADATVRGVEGWLESLILPAWRVTGGFTVLRERTTLEPGRVNIDAPPYGNNPRRTFSIRSLWDVTAEHEVDLTWRHVSELPNPAVPSYSSLDLRLAWQPTRQLEVAAVVQNLLGREHAEYGAPAGRSVFGREWLIKVTYSPW